MAAELSTTPDGKGGFRMGRFLFDPSQLLLFENSRLVPLAPKAARILLILLENRGRLVEKETLMRVVWPDCFVEEANVAVYVSQLRKALSSGAVGGPVPIETIPRRGYRYVGEAVLDEAIQPKPAAVNWIAARFALPGQIPGPAPMANAPARTSLHLFRPSRKLWGGRPGFVFGIGIAIGIPLLVAVMALRAHLEPHASGQGRPQTARAASGFAASRAAYRKMPEDLGTSSAAALELYREGRYSLGSGSQYGIQQAVRKFEKAISLDPGFALAYSGLADCYVFQGLQMGGDTRLLKQRAEAAALMAVARDSRRPEVHNSLGAVEAAYEWDLTGAHREFRTALAIDPAYAPARRRDATLYLAPLARLEEAVAQEEQAGQLDPQDLSQYLDLGWLYYLQRRYPRAIWEYRQALVIDPAFYPACFRLAQIYFIERNYGSAAREIAAGVRMTTGPRAARLLLSAYARSGFPGLQRLISQNATREWEGGKPGTGLDVALQAVWAGNSDLARRALRRAVEQREPGAIYFKIDPAWDSLRSSAFVSELQLRAGPFGK